MKQHSRSSLSANAFDQLATVGEICNRFGGGVQTGPFGSQLHASDYSAEGIPIVMPQDMVDGLIVCDRIARVPANLLRELSRHQLQVGDVVFSRRGDVSRFAVVTEREQGWICGTGSIRIRLNCPSVDTRYLRHYLQQDAVGDWLRHRAKGVTMPNLNTEIICAIPLHLPPLAEQRRIAAILDQADALLRKRREASTTTITLGHAFFIGMFGNTTRSNQRWPVYRFSELTETKLGKMLDKAKFKGKQKYRYIRNANVQWFRLDLSDLAEMEFSDAELIRYSLRPGDILICEGGEPGRCAIWNCENEEPILFQKALHRCRVDRTNLTPEFICYLLRNLADTGGLSESTTSATIAHLTAEKLAELKIPVPPLALQRQFSERIAAIEGLMERNRSHFRRLEDLFASLQHRAFSGKL